VLVSCLFGAFRGLVKEALSLAFWIGAAVLANLFDEQLGQRLDFVDNTALRPLVAFVIIFIVTVFAGGLVSNLISGLMSRAGLGGTDRVLGALFGIIRGVVIVTLIVMFTAGLDQTRELYGQSMLMPYVIVLTELFQSMFGLTPDVIDVNALA
jgi:membrane protein required for colicin V production